MKKIKGTILGLFALGLLLSPYLGIIFAGTLILAIVGNVALQSAILASYLSIAWKVYVALAMLSFFIIITFTYQNCCVGLQNFRTHLRHSGRYLFEGLIGSLIWPVCWLNMNLNYRNWGLPWGEIVYQAFKYWLVDIRKGISIETVELHHKD